MAAARTTVSISLGCWLLCAATAPLTAQQADAPPMPPSGDALEQARERVRGAFPRIGTKVSQRQAAQLAEELAGTATEETDPAAKYALLDQAVQAAADSGDADLVRRTVDALATAFATDRLNVEIDALAQARARANSKRASRAVLDRVLDLVDAAIQADRLALAAAGAEQALRSAKALALPRLPGALRGVATSLQTIAATSRDHEADRSADADARLALAYYLHLTRGRWDLAAPMLLAAPAEPLRALAQQDLDGAASGAEQKALADAWWQRRGASETAMEQLICAARARHWYSTALPELAGLAKKEVERRLTKLQAGGASGARGTAESTMRRARVPYGKQLLVNPSCEQAPGSADGGWRSTQGVWFHYPCKADKDPGAKHGSFVFSPKKPCARAVLEQTVELGDYAHAIDAGKVAMTFEGFAAHYRQKPGDGSQVAIDFLDGNGSTLGEPFESDMIKSATWRKITREAHLPKGTRTIRIELRAVRFRGRTRQKNNNGYFDDLSLKLTRAR